MRESESTSRGQTGLGGMFGIVIVILVILGVVNIGYTYTATPALDATDTTTESAALADYLIHTELSPASPTTATGGGPRLSTSEVRSFFQPPRDTTGVADHWVGEASISWNVTIKNGVDTSESVLDGEQTLTAGSSPRSPPTWASEYERPAMLDGDIVIVEVETWS